MKPKRLWTLLSVVLFSTFLVTCLQAQTITIRGNVKNEDSKETIPSVSVIIKNTPEGTYTDSRGNFSIATQRKLPLTLAISSVGFEPQEVVVNSGGQTVAILLKPTSALGQAVVVSGTRTPTRILESPVSIERIGSQAIRDAAVPSYYDNIKNLKGVDVVNSGLLFATPTSRGFSASGNARLNQIVDGMDNQAPGLNFPVGNSVGLTELDVDNMELLPGASSALYGSGGMNGTLLINSKNPFKFQGFSAQVKQGINHVNDDYRGAAAYYDIAGRYAKNFNNKLAFKITAQYLKAQDWQANDRRNYDRANTKIDNTNRASNPNYDGINVYGDETNFNMAALSGGIYGSITGGQAQLQAAIAQVRAAISAQGYDPDNQPANAPAAIIALYVQQTQLRAQLSILNAQASQFRVIDSVARNTSPGQRTVSRTGYNEDQSVDHSTYNLKGNVGLFYKITPSTEISWQTYIGRGTTVYTGSDRYSLRNFTIAQHKLEIKGSNWFARAWTTQENAGDAYNATVMMRLLNEASKPTFSDKNVAGSWGTQYISAYTQAYLTARGTGATTAQAELAAHAAARPIADQGRLEPGTSQFQQVFNSIAKVPISRGGAQFLDRTDLYMAEGQYKFDKIKAVEILVGASAKRYVLNSQGTLFADTAGRININEYGGFVQLQKSLFNDWLKLNFAGRYDKSTNFKGRFTPRVTALIKIVEDNNIRLSYQQAYRFPTTQNQWINLPAGSTIVLGGLPQLREFYKMTTNPVYTVQNVTEYGAAFQAAYINAKSQGRTDAEAFAIAAAASVGVLKPHQFGEYKPESMNSYEIGYKGLSLKKKLLVDAYVFWSNYHNYLGRVNVIQSKSQLQTPIKETGLIQQNPDRTTVGDRQVYSVSANASETLKVFGWGISADYNFYKNYTIGANVAYNELKENNLPSGFLNYWATPKYRFNASFANNNVFRNFGFNITMRHQSAFFYESDFALGDVPAFTTVDAQISKRIPSIKSIVKIGGSNITNHYYINGLANPQIGGLYYISFGYNLY